MHNIICAHPAKVNTAIARLASSIELYRALTTVAKEHSLPSFLALNPSPNMAGALSGCVSSLQSSIALLDSSIQILDAGVHDFPRLSNTLQTTRVRISPSPSLHRLSHPLPLRLARTLTPHQHFELLPESTLQSAQAALLASITPEIQRLLARVETHLDRLARREQALVAKAALLAGRLGAPAGRPGRGAPTGGGAPADAGPGVATDVELDRAALRMKQLRQKKERLSFAVERLELQARQKERQLRMSMAQE